MYASAGTDTYGRVKTIGGTPIVTKFVMAQMLPIYTLQSIYALGSSTEDIPISIALAGGQSVSVDGIPLAKLDTASVAIAYVRGVMGAMMLIGFFSIVPVLSLLMGEQLDNIAMTAMRILIGSFVFGVIGGMITYVIPFASRRERRIREYCGELLGICADPARIEVEYAAEMETDLESDESPELQSDSRFALIYQLILCRIHIAKGNNRDELELESDRILRKLQSLHTSPE